MTAFHTERLGLNAAHKQMFSGQPIRTREIITDSMKLLAEIGVKSGVEVELSTESGYEHVLVSGENGTVNAVIAEFQAQHGCVLTVLPSLQPVNAKIAE